MLHNYLIPLLLTYAVISQGQQYPIRIIETGTNASFRGLSVGDEGAVWVGGSKGTIGRSTDNGDHWAFKQVPGYEQCDFRSVYAFDANTAIIANAGSPAYILRTADGGKSWQKVYENKDSAAFIDGIDFWNNKRGLVHGDPIEGRMLLLYTHDAGRSWKARKNGSRPQLEKGQASFAASGTAIHCMAGRRVVVATGGTAAEVYLSRNSGRRWKAIPTPMLSGEASQGIFSIQPLSSGAESCIIAGGDYLRDTVSTANLFYTRDRGKTWQHPSQSTRGYRECLVVIADDSPESEKGKTYITLAVGPGGIDISADMGASWKPYSDEKGFHVIKASRNHMRLFLAGSNGKLGVMEMAPQP